MLGSYVGICVTNKELTKTRNIHGPLSQISGTCLFVIERNPEGDCLCMLSNIGLVDVDASDVRSFIEIKKEKSPMELFEQLLKECEQNEEYVG